MGCQSAVKSLKSYRYRFMNNKVKVKTKQERMRVKTKIWGGQNRILQFERVFKITKRHHHYAKNHTVNKNTNTANPHSFKIYLLKNKNKHLFYNLKNSF